MVFEQKRRHSPLQFASAIGGGGSLSLLMDVQRTLWRGMFRDGDC